MDDRRTGGGQAHLDILAEVQVCPANVDDAPAMAHLLMEGFAPKMRAVFGNRLDGAKRLLASVFARRIGSGWDGALVARSDGRLLGMLDIGELVPNWGEGIAYLGLACRELGLWGTLRSLPGMAMLVEGSPAPDEAYIADLVVDEQARGRRVGQALIETAADWGRRHGRRRLTLHVAANNAPAIRLYERCGFQVARRERSLLSRWIFGIGEWWYMVRSLE
jgi:ribosomal protein S18 acetylase RimI-like enzyme